MKTVIRMSNFNGKTGYEIISYPENTEEDIPDTSNVGKEFYELNYKGLFCYGLKVILFPQINLAKNHAAYLV